MPPLPTVDNLLWYNMGQKCSICTNLEQRETWRKFDWRLLGDESWTGAITWLKKAPITFERKRITHTYMCVIVAQLNIWIGIFRFLSTTGLYSLVYHWIQITLLSIQVCILNSSALWKNSLKWYRDGTEGEIFDGHKKGYCDAWHICAAHQKINLGGKNFQRASMNTKSNHQHDVIGDPTHFFCKPFKIEFGS